MAADTHDPSTLTSAAGGPNDSVANHVIVLYGATGDLAQRKLWPGLYHLQLAGLMPDQFAIVGAGRADHSDADLRGLARQAAANAGHAPLDEEQWARFAARLSYATIGDDGRWAATVDTAERRIAAPVRRLHYLAVPSAAMEPIVRQIKHAGLSADSRVVLEKPFGTDLASARQLSAVLHEVFEEEQLFRIDHFLGKEAVQNILALRFANGTWESLWHRAHIEHVQIDVPETLGVGTRSAFYEATGAYRDMVVTHLFQVLGFVAMEPPAALRPRELVAETTRVFQALRPLAPGDVVRGQYDGYRDEPGVQPGSQIETFVAARAWVDNERWAGVPFYLRTGKRMASSGLVVTIAFRRPTTSMFSVGHGRPAGDPDHLSFDLGEHGSISLGFLAKTPGPGVALQPARLRYSFAAAPGHAQSLQAYERLIHDALIGDHTLFTSSAGIERLWEISAAVLATPPPLRSYPPGSWGPTEAEDLPAPSAWHLGGSAHRARPPRPEPGLG
jgi:glucose-6-phosphate 1-dehydrogenase